MTALAFDRRPFQTDVPARLDALPWSRWHTRVVVALGVTWVLDGLEVTLAGTVGGAVKDRATLGLTDGQVGLSSTAYLIGAVVGALAFGYLTDRYGRRRLFFATLALYVSATAATAFSWSAASYYLFRGLTGAGIGGEYAAINSAVDELIPARLRGRVDLVINSTFWLGAALGAVVTLFVLNPALIPVRLGWRLAFGTGAVLGVGILFLRNAVPESPRWLMIHGRRGEAEQIVVDVETQVGGRPPGDRQPTTIHPRPSTPWREVARAMLVTHRDRSLLGLSLMIAQALFYNAAGFFTYALVLGRFFHVPAARLSYYLFPFAVGNILGPLLLGRLFDVVGRKAMIVGTYAASGVLLAVAAVLFDRGTLTPVTQTVAWSAVFFVASCAASSAYLTVSEVFPLELRGVAISLFYAVGTLVGGAAAPAVFGKLIDSGSRRQLMWGYLVTAAVMAGGAAAEATFGVKAEGRSLEEITKPLSSR